MKSRKNELEDDDDDEDKVDLMNLTLLGISAKAKAAKSIMARQARTTGFILANRRQQWSLSLSGCVDLVAVLCGGRDDCACRFNLLYISRRMNP